MFLLVLYGSCVICAALFFFTRSQESIVQPPGFPKFQAVYLIGFLLAAGGDWLQGPHVYALYDSYKLSKHDIELLFVAGFGSSVLFGTFVGSIADKLGRRKNCLLYGVIYGAACLTKHSSSFYILLIGRILGGVATSILFSAFESWLVFEHNKRGFNSDLLSVIFSNATLGNSLVAILAGVVAQFAADIFGYVAPFDVSMGVLIFMCLYIASTWTENFGDARANFGDSFQQAWKTLKEDRKVLFLGIVQSLFEGSMYTFVLEWTPALSVTSAGSNSNGSSQSTSAEASIPHGYIFATFMVSVMVGSSLFRLLSSKTTPESFMRFVLVASAVCLLPPVLCPDCRWLVYLGFIAFEVCVGLFWPSIGFMRGIYLPEAARSTVMNFFRVPLNLIVIAILVQNFPMKVIFMCCVVFLCLAALAQCALYREHIKCNVQSKRAIREQVATID